MRVPLFSLLALSSSTTKITKSKPLDVLIIGAGWAGLGAATYLQTNNTTNFLIVEGRDYIGGRSRTLTLNDGITRVELGSQWVQGVNHHHTRNNNKVNDNGNSNTNNNKNPVYEATLASDTGFVPCSSCSSSPDGYHDDDPRVGTSGNNAAVYVDDSGDDYDDAMTMMNHLTDEHQRKLVHDLFDGPKGFFGYQAELQDEGEYDRSLRDIANEFATRKGLDGFDRRAFEWILDSYIAEEYAASLDDLSHWWWDDDAELEGCDLYLAKDTESGFTNVIQHYAKPIIDKICLQNKVLDVNWTEVPVSVKVVRALGGEDTVYARNVLVTAPLGCLKGGSIRFVPCLPQKKLDAINKLGMGCLTKCCLLWNEYDELPWPKDKEWIEQIARDGCQGRWTEFYSPLPINGRPLLYAYSPGWQAISTEKLTDNQIKEEVMRKLNAMFGKGLPEPRHVVVSRWKEDEFSKGSYSFYKVGSNPSHRRALARPLDNRLYFAGEATHVKHFGTSQGALLSGVDAAKQIKRNL